MGLVGFRLSFRFFEVSSRDSELYLFYRRFRGGIVWVLVWFLGWLGFLGGFRWFLFVLEFFNFFFI